MIRIAVVGNIGSGKTHISKLFGYPVFNADAEVVKLYRKNRKCYRKLKKILPNYIKSFPVKKSELLKAIIVSSYNLKKIVKIVHPEVRNKLNIFNKKNRNKKFVVLDIPLLIENKINKKNDILVFVDAKKKDIYRKLKKRNKTSIRIVKNLQKVQLPIERKKKKADFIIKNDFRNNSTKKNVKRLKEKILLNA